MISREELISNIGKYKYSQLDDDGKALGCTLPVYLMYPDIIGKHEWYSNDVNKRDYMLNLFEKYGTQIDINCLEYGDVITMNFPMEYYHIAVYLGNNEIIHCSPKKGLEISKISMYRNRIDRGYRVNGISVIR